MTRSISSTIKHPTTIVLIKLVKLVKLELLYDGWTWETPSYQTWPLISAMKVFLKMDPSPLLFENSLPIQPWSWY